MLQASLFHVTKYGTKGLEHRCYLLIVLLNKPACPQLFHNGQSGSPKMISADCDVETGLLQAPCLYCHPINSDKATNEVVFIFC